MLDITSFGEVLVPITAGAMWVVAEFAGILNRFGALPLIITLVILLILVRRMFRHGGAGASDTARKKGKSENE